MEEKVLIEGVFKTPKWIVVVPAVLCGFCVLLILLMLLSSEFSLALTFLLFSGCFALPLYLAFRGIRDCKLTITNQRVYGTTEFGHSVNIPLDKISSVKRFYSKGINFSYADGTANFPYCQNVSDVYAVASELLTKNSIKNSSDETSNAEEIKKYKELLDCGAITKEEFEKKKKQLLGL